MLSLLSCTATIISIQTQNVAIQAHSITQVGTYTITFVATDETGNQSTLEKTYTITEAPVEEPLDPGTPTGYYSTAEGQTGFTVKFTKNDYFRPHNYVLYQYK